MAKKGQSLDLRRFRKLLLAERQRLLDELSWFTQRDKEEGDARCSADAEDDPDTAASLAERQREAGQRASLQNLLAKTDKALAKIEEGDYGLCEICEQPIAPTRLEALPSALLCIRCQEQLEG